MSSVKGRGGGKPGAVVTGVVRIITDPKNASQLQDGEILVTPMTDVDFVPAMMRAMAVVTDRGGIVCHAAVVCTELGVPFVVGAKTASTAFKTGTKVSVDVTAGTVTVV